MLVPERLDEVILSIKTGCYKGGCSLGSCCNCSEDMVERMLWGGFVAVSNANPGFQLARRQSFLDGPFRVTERTVAKTSELDPLISGLPARMHACIRDDSQLSQQAQ